MSSANRRADLRSHLRDMGRYLIELADQPELEEADLPAIPFASSGGASRYTDDSPILAGFAAREYERRTLRSEYFKASLFAEPAWDMLLDLFVAKANGHRISVSSACIASKVASTTALRWLAILEEQGLVDRTDDFQDRRRTWVELSDQGYKAMADYLRHKHGRRAVSRRDSSSPFQEMHGESS